MQTGRIDYGDRKDIHYIIDGKDKKQAEPTRLAPLPPDRKYRLQTEVIEPRQKY